MITTSPYRTRYLRISPHIDRSWSECQLGTKGTYISQSNASLCARTNTITTVDERGTDIIIPSAPSGTWELLYSNTQLFRSLALLHGRSIDMYPRRSGRHGTRLVSAICIVRQLAVSTIWDRPTDYYQ
jgi:hypothetical protein